MKKRRRTMSTESVEIPHDIIVEVLTRLPAMSLLRFRCVCKFWNLTISDAQFMESRRMRSESRFGGNYLVTFWVYGNRIIIDFKDHDDGRRRSMVPPPIHLIITTNKNVTYHPISVSRPLNGMICFSSGVHGAAVLNISTRQILHLPKPKYYSGGKFEMVFDDVNGEYKVLLWRCSYGMIYTIGSDSSWRITMDTPPEVSRTEQRTWGLCLNGTMYWLVPHEADTYLVDVGREVFRTRKLIESLNWRNNLFVVGGSLACIPLKGVQHCTEMWFLEECQESNRVLVKKRISLWTRIWARLSSPNAISWGISPTGETFLLDCNESRKIYVDLKENMISEKINQWYHPRMHEQDEVLGSLFQRKCYNHVENMYRFKDRDVQHCNFPFMRFKIL